MERHDNAWRDATQAGERTGMRPPQAAMGPALVGPALGHEAGAPRLDADDASVLLGETDMLLAGGMGPFHNDAMVPSYSSDLSLRLFDINGAPGGSLVDGPSTVTGAYGGAHGVDIGGLFPGAFPQTAPAHTPCLRAADRALTPTCEQPGPAPIGFGMADPLSLKADVLADLTSPRPRTPGLPPGGTSATVAAALAQAGPSVRQSGMPLPAPVRGRGTGEPMELGTADLGTAAGGSHNGAASGSAAAAAVGTRNQANAGGVRADGENKRKAPEPAKADAAHALLAAGSPADMDDDDEPADDRLAGVTDEKERKRLKRLLRNRVSAQQARERKKCYVSSLEQRVKDLESNVGSLELKVKTLEREKFMLLEVVKKTREPRGVL